MRAVMVMDSAWTVNARRMGLHGQVWYLSLVSSWFDRI